MSHATNYKQVANRIRMEMDGRSPRLRLSVIGYLLDAGFLPNADNYFELVDQVVDYIARDMDDYATTVESFVDPDETTNDTEKDVDAYKVLKDKLNDGPYL